MLEVLLNTRSFWGAVMMARPRKAWKAASESEREEVGIVQGQARHSFLWHCSMSHRNKGNQLQKGFYRKPCAEKCIVEIEFQLKQAVNVQLIDQLQQVSLEPLVQVLKSHKLSQ